MSATAQAVPVFDASSDLSLILALYRVPRTRDVALELADRNRENAAKAQPKKGGTK